MRIVLDTNVLVSGLLSPHGHPARILQGALAGTITICHCEAILAEYREVLARPRFGFDGNLVGEVLDRIETAGESVVPAPLNLSLPDPDDEVFLETAIAAVADGLVTGNVRHYPVRSRRGALVITPAQFVAELGKR